MKKSAKMLCPLCGKEHELEIRERNNNIEIKGQIVEYKETFYYCEFSDEDENEFVDGKMLNQNLLRAKDAYRENNGLLTSKEIKSIRIKYSLTQTELSTILGWGEITITRYESKQIQDRAYDKLLRQFNEDPSWAYELLIAKRTSFTNERFARLREIFIHNIEDAGNEATARKMLRNQYSFYSEPSELNGYIVLDIDKIEAMISYFATKQRNLHKVKLIKELWYSDMLCYQKTGHSITGLVYSHEPMGALPIGHYELMSLDNVLFLEEFPTGDFEYSSITLLPNNRIQYSFSDLEIEIMDKVIAKFKRFSGKDLSEYMHQEKAYSKTKNREFISFSWAKELNPF
jgi:putative zinc finger/helix-turn-helix YgiT family protein